MLIRDSKAVLEGRAEVAVVMMDWEMIGSPMEVTCEDLVPLEETGKREVALGVILESMVVRVMNDEQMMVLVSLILVVCPMDLMLIRDRKTVLEGEVEVVEMMDWEGIGSRMEETCEDLAPMGEMVKRKVALGVILESMVVRVMNGEQTMI
jgi:hypothetical protein